jgi:phage-related protein
MMAAGEWTVEFYLTDDGTAPVAEFLGDLDPKTRARFRWSIEQLRVRNTRAGPPLVKHLDGDLWELREESSTNIYRVIYVFFTGRRIVLLHGFQKKTQKTPAREIETARRRHRDFLDREKRRAER